jgi:A/G-specific adenine glycosylase
VDGNVLRVASRVTNDAAEISLPASRRRLASAAQSWLDPCRPGDFNQAMMELGATVCVPRTPACSVCPVAALCAARVAGTEKQLPVKLKKAEAREVPLDLLLLRRAGKVLLRQRGAAEKRLAGFWELPEHGSIRVGGLARMGEFTHQIVNDRFRVTIWKATPPAGPIAGARWFTDNELEAAPVSTITRKALQL